MSRGTPTKHRPGNASIDDSPAQAPLSAFYAPRSDALVRLIHGAGLHVELASTDYAAPEFADYACAAEPCAWPY